MVSDPARTLEGHHRADELRSGDPYELSHGRQIACMPTGGDGTGPNGRGYQVLDTDPLVKNAGVDTGLKLDEHTLRAPDVAVNYGEEKPGWVTTVPPLAVEYVAGEADEDDLMTKVGELMDAGTRWVWVVRLSGPRRVEVYERGAPMRVVGVGGELTAPGVLQLPVPVRALYDRNAAHETTLRNLLARKGYGSLDAVREEGRAEGLTGLRTALRAGFAARGWSVTPEQSARLDACADVATLVAWTTRVFTAESPDTVFAA